MTTATILMFTLLFAPPSHPQPVPPPPESDTQVELRQFACSSFLEIMDAQDGRGDVFLVWAHGYHAAAAGLDETNAPAMNWRTVEAFAERLVQTCRDNPSLLWVRAVRSPARP